MEAVCRILTYGTVYKVLTSGVTLYLWERLRFREEVALRDKGQERRLNFPRNALEFGKRSFS